MGFSVTREQRQRLLAGDYSALDFDTKPYGLEPGAVYVLSWQKATATVVSDKGAKPVVVARTPRHPVWYVTVTKVVRHRKGHWRALIEVTDLRDTDVFLRRGGGESSFDELRAGAKPPRWWADARAKTISEFDHQRRLAAHAELLRERGRERSRARRKRAA